MSCKTLVIQKVILGELVCFFEVQTQSKGNRKPFDLARKTPTRFKIKCCRNADQNHNEMKLTENSGFGKDLQKLEPLFIAGGSESGVAPVENTGNSLKSQIYNYRMTQQFHF